MHKTQFCALLFSINIFQRVIVLCQITHPFFYCCIPLYFADVPKLNSTSLPLIDIWVVLNLFLLPINATSKLMYISYFCRLHLGMDYLKTGWLGLKVNAYVILLDIARFPSVVAIPFVFHQRCLRRLFPHSLSSGVWPNFGISAHLIGQEWYLVRILVCLIL